MIVDANVLGRRRTGDEAYVENLLREFSLDGDGLAIAAITGEHGWVPARIERIELSSRSQALRLFFRLPSVIRARRPALAHFQYIIPPGVGVRSVVTVHDISFADHDYAPAHDRLAMRALVPRSLRKAVTVFTVSEWTRAQIVDRYGIPSDRIVVTPNGVDPAFTAEGDRSAGEPYILFVGAIEPRKDPVAAVETLARLNDGTRLVMVGPPKRAMSSVRAAVERHGLQDRVQLRGYVGKSELAALYRGARCLLFPSRYEGFGLPIIEAMACGTPVVATGATAIPEIAGGAAVLVSAPDPEALADGVRRADADRAELRSAGLARAATFRWAETARLTLSAYRQALL